MIICSLLNLLYEGTVYWVNPLCIQCVFSYGFVKFNVLLKLGVWLYEDFNETSWKYYRYTTDVEWHSKDGARDDNKPVRPDPRMLPQELCDAVISRPAHPARVYETTACVHQLCHQEQHPPGR